MSHKTTAFQSYISEILENLPGTVFVKDAKHLRFIYVNKAAEDLLGITREELIGKNDCDFFPKDQADFFISIDRQVLEKAELLDIAEEPINTKFKGKRWLHTKKIPIYDEHNQPAYLVGISEDITERKKAEDLLNMAREELETKLHETESIYKTILDNAFEGVITFNEEGTIQTYNSACEHMFGYRPKEALFHDIERLIPKLKGLYKKELKEGLSQTVQDIENISGHKKDGTTFPVELSLKKMVLENNIRFCIIIRDISVHVAAEQERKEYLQKLEAKNRELNDFSYIASHDLKGPLRGIHNYAHFLLEDYEDKIDKPGQDMLHTLGALTQQLEEYLDILFQYSRLGREKLSLKMTDMNTLVKKVIDLYTPEIKNKNIDIKISTFPEAICDSVKTSEVFNNLINNALKYRDDTTQGLIELGYVDQNSSALPQHVFYVRDNGIGVAPEHHDAVFKIFKRLHIKDAYRGGSGSGLTISKKIVERHGGQIWVESEGEGKGTTFFFSLPKSYDEAFGNADI